MPVRTPQIRNQMYIFPELLADKIETKPHSARFFQYLAGVLKLNLYRVSTQGTPPYARPVLVAVILYAMQKGHFSAGGILEFAADSIGAQWILNGMDMPSYKTVQRTIDDLLEELDEVFIQILDLCSQLGLIGGKRIYIDGTKIKANASKHQAMSYGYLNKKIGKGKEELKALFAAFRDTLDGLEEIPEEDLQTLVLEDSQKVHKELQKSHQDALLARQKEIFDPFAETQPLQSQNDQTSVKLKNSLKTMKNIEPEKQDEALEMLNDMAFISGRVFRMEGARNKLEKKWKAEHGDKKIPEKQQINFTDPDSSIMQTKHQGVQQCYNHFALVDDRANIILGTYTSNNACDQISLIPTIENTEKTYGSLEGLQMGADTGFFSSANISYTKSKGIDYYVSYPEAKSPYAKDKFRYDWVSDTYTCPEGNILAMQKQSRDGESCLYSNETACLSCKSCKDCAKAKDGIRRIERNMEHDKIREDAKEKAKSEEGREILRLRKSIPEPVWGNIKVQDGFIQMHYRGIEKATLEFNLHSLMQNIRKMLKVYFKSSGYQDSIHRSDRMKGFFRQTA